MLEQNQTKAWYALLQNTPPTVLQDQAIVSTPAKGPMAKLLCI